MTIRPKLKFLPPQKVNNNASSWWLYKLNYFPAYYWLSIISMLLWPNFIYSRWIVMCNFCCFKTFTAYLSCIANFHTRWLELTLVDILLFRAGQITGQNLQMLPRAVPEFKDKALCHEYLLYLNKWVWGLLNNLLTQNKQYCILTQSFFKQK